MRLNNKGFAISSIMYIILIMCIILITVTLSILSSRNLILDKQKRETLNGIYNEEVYNSPSIPELIGGLTPVVYQDNNWKVADTSKEWYNYSKQEWANAVILNTNVSKNLGDTINVDSEVKAMFVWIPRYEYKIEGDYGKGGTSASLPGEIEVNFVSKSRTGLRGKYRVHPAFTFGSEELNGIWVGKFETTGMDSNPTILPSVESLRSQNISAQFETSQKFNSYIANGNSHMAKNSEWGAVVYLSQSKYGKYGNPNYEGAEKQVMVNNCSSSITGIGADSKNDAASTATCTTNTYETDKGQAASTTGNITGIYDMSGGAWERTMGVLLDPNGNPRSGSSTSNNSGYTGMLNNGTIYSGKELPDEKYYETYTSTNPSSSSVTLSETACSNGVCYGQALSETKNWYGDYAYFAYLDNPWFSRGGNYDNNSGTGVFGFYYSGGYAGSSHSFRVVVSYTKNS